MNITHRLEVRDGVLQNVMYVYYPAEYEFSLDLGSLKTHVVSVVDKVREYALKNVSKISNDSILIILNGVAVGTVLLTQIIAESNLKKTHQDVTKNVEQIVSINNYKNDAPLASLQEEQKEQVDTSKENTTESSSTNDVVTTNATNTGSVSDMVLTDSTTIIPLKLSDGNIIQIGLEEYVVGVVGAEMPAEYNTEALKAQAVAARTYALKKIAAGIVLTSNTETQCYKTERELKEMWGDSFDKYYTKIQNAVYSTKGECITYNSELIEAFYFSTSNGKTEDAINVWGFSKPYLKSVDSCFDVGTREYVGTKTISKKDFCDKLGVSEEALSSVSIVSKTDGDRVGKIKIGDKIFDGVNLRKLLSLRSADFDIAIDGDNVVITTRGWGHGVGMSQRGANYLATNKGYNYKQILNYYYTDVTIEKSA